MWKGSLHHVSNCYNQVVRLSNGAVIYFGQPRFVFPVERIVDPWTNLQDKASLANSLPVVGREPYV